MNNVIVNYVLAFVGLSHGTKIWVRAYKEQSLLFDLYKAFD